MITKRVNRYYCEHCRKGGQSAAHMSRHEKGCTLNPGRVCGFCKEVGEDQAPMADLMAIMATAKVTSTTDFYAGVTWTSSSIENEKEVIKALEDATGNCPACMLAAIRQSKYPEVFEHFDFKDRQREFWNQVNEDRMNWGS